MKRVIFLREPFGKLIPAVNELLSASGITLSPASNRTSVREQRRKLLRNVFCAIKRREQYKESRNALRTDISVRSN